MWMPKVLWIAGSNADIVDQSRVSLTLASNALHGLECLRREEFDVVLANCPLDDVNSPASLLEELQQAQPHTPVVIQIQESSNTQVVRLLHLGAFHVLQFGDATSVLYMAANSKRAQECFAAGERESWRGHLIGESRPIEEIADMIRLVAPRRSTILITGETGTGKEMVARAIHAASPRAHLGMVCVNCSALPEALLEAELFGHVRGAFTGAVQQRTGRFEQANHGSIFLDEIGDMPLSIQAKLLRVLQEHEFQRLGSSETIRVDVRVIAATHASLPAMIAEGKFREDLYYRLNVVPIAVSPLRDRPSDVRLLVPHFIEKICSSESLPVKQISLETLDRLAGFDWPGNVRQLENAVEKAIVLSGERTALYPGDFPLAPRKYPASSQICVPDHGLDFDQTVGRIERNILEQALKKSGGNKKLAAQMLGLKRTTLSAKLKSLVATSAAG
jgi:DNA-binding NtrC family response regulator